MTSDVVSAEKKIKGSGRELSPEQADRAARAIEDCRGLRTTGICRRLKDGRLRFGCPAVCGDRTENDTETRVEMGLCRVEQCRRSCDVLLAGVWDPLP